MTDLPIAELAAMFHTLAVMTRRMPPGSNVRSALVDARAEMMRHAIAAHGVPAWADAWEAVRRG